MRILDLHGFEVDIGPIDSVLYLLNGDPQAVDEAKSPINVDLDLLDLNQPDLVEKRGENLL